MRTRHTCITLAVAAALALVSGAGTSQAGPWIEGELLEFSLLDLEGNTVSHDDERFRGKVVLVTLWGTWCPPCITEIPTFNDLHARLSDDGLVVVGIAFERAGDAGKRREGLLRFMKEHPVDYLVLDGGSTKDAGTALPALRDVKGLPVEIFVGRDGRVIGARNGYGHSESWARELEEKLVEMLEPTSDD